jgi:phage shock protein C
MDISGAGPLDAVETIRRPAVRKVYVSKTDKKIAGICGGIGEALDIDPTLVRLGAIFLCLATAIIPVALTYIVAWVIIPEKPPDAE